MELKNPKRERFCQEYMIDLNASQAYLRTGYTGKNPNARAAELKAIPSVKARIEELMAELSIRTGMNQDRVLRELARIGFLDPTKLINAATATVLEDASDDDRAAIASVKVKQGATFTEREVRFADKLKALELLGKHLGMFTERIDFTQDIILDFGGGAEPPVRIIERINESDGK